MRREILEQQQQEDEEDGERETVAGLLVDALFVPP
jgi:hypothetical protein